MGFLANIRILVTGLLSNRSNGIAVEITYVDGGFNTTSLGSTEA